MRTLIRHGRVVNAGGTSVADVLVEGETIAAVESSLALEADRVIDASGKLILPGGIDAHTHLDMPLDADVRSADDFESGTIAAAIGGTTTIIDYATQFTGETLRHALETWLRKAEGRAVVDYGFHMIVSDFSDGVEAEMDALVRDGVPSFKLFTAYPGRLMLDDGRIFRAMLRTAENGGLVCLHAENGHVIDVLVRRALAEGRTAPRVHAETRPAGAEAEAVHRGIALAELAGAAVYIVHVSSAEALAEVVRGRARGARVVAETCPQYLCLSDERYDVPGLEGAKYVMSPPLRPKAGQERLWSGLATGGIQTVATDHCPFTLAEKARGAGDFSKIPNGAPGIETRMSLVFDDGVRAGRLSLERFVDVTSTAPAKVFGLYPRKGVIAPGSDADLVVWNAEKTTTISAATHHMKVDYNPYEGRQVTGIAEVVLSRGQVIVERGRFVGRAGAGRFLKRAAFR